jgi:hypothetical protein
VGHPWWNRHRQELELAMGLGLELANSKSEMGRLLHYRCQTLPDILSHSKHRSVHTTPIANSKEKNRGTCSHWQARTKHQG